ncbi:MAG: protein kinase [Thermoanaerobaculia bacterium]
MIGTTLSHFRITAKLGEGGMGEVYQAEDTKLGRQVAIKVLPEAVASDPERLARFEREAKVLASLNHPNIAAIYSFESAERLGDPLSPASPSPQAPKPLSPVIHFLVMEMVDGATLEELIEQGVPPEQAIEMAGQVAEALEEAHGRGIIHRDLKPANVKVTPEGKVKVLDFGLAKALDPQDLETPGPQDLSLSPTLTAQMTGAGMLLGTAAYMSPEQARGQEAGKQADIWAFGVVLWEMLSGQRLFAGPTVSDTLAEVLKTNPDLDVLPESVPPAVHRLLRRCLERDPNKRLRDIGDARLELDEALSEPVDSVTDAPSAPNRTRWMLGAAGLLLGLVLGAALYSAFSPTSEPTLQDTRSPRRSILIPELLDGPRNIQGLAISPDASSVALGQAYGSENLLELRHLDSLESTAVPGTEGASFPFFSPDGEWLAYFDDDELRKVPTAGGPSAVICEARTSLGGTWADDGWIYFLHGESRLARVPADGGEPEELMDESVFNPHALPGGRGILATLALGATSSSRKESATIALVKADGTYKSLLEGGYAPRYLPSGHLLYVQQGDLFAAPFDLESLEVSGPGTRVISEVFTDSIWSVALYDVAQDGTLVYLQGGDLAATIPTWISRDGTTEPLSMPQDVYGTFQLSPDRSRLAIQVAAAQDQIHVYDFARETLARLTFEGPSNYPTWTRDGQEVIYQAFRDGTATVMRRRVDGSGAEIPVLTGEKRRLIDASGLNPYTVSPDGRYLIVTSWGNLETGADLWLLDLTGEEDPQALLQTSHNEIIPMFSPDGDYIVYLSDKAGPYGIYVRPFPDVQSREWTISAGDGYDARWSPTRDEILYRVGATRFMSVPFSLEPEFTPGTERLILDIDAHDSAGYSFDLSADGERILVNKPSVSFRDPRPVLMVTDWLSEFETRVPTD